MECVVDSNWLLSLLWSALWFVLIVQMDRVNGFNSGLKDIFSAPIVSSLLFSFVYIYFTFEMPESTDKGLVGLVNRLTYGISYIKCSFVSVLNVWGTLLMVVAIYKFIKKNFPSLIDDLKEKLGL
jgi:hypothetical protein